MNSAITSLVGQKFGRLTVIEFSEIRKQKSYWQCQCSCGQSKVILGASLTSGKVSSCGCLRRETSRTLCQSRSTHGMTKSRAYKAWKGMRDRCTNPKTRNFHRWGGRGIQCLWESFEHFYKDMGDPPTAKHSLDRIDNDSHYCKANCRWATSVQQNSNRHNTTQIALNGKTQNVSAWAHKFGLIPTTVFRRLNKGWSIEQALGVAWHPDRRNRKKTKC